MKILNPLQYKNMFDYISLSSMEIEEQLINFKLEFYKTRNKVAEWQLKIPPFITAFYTYVWKQNKIPKQHELWHWYVALNNEYFIVHDYADEIIKGLQARVYRTYPSLVRDIHFITYIKEHLHDACVVYNTNLDIEDGIDILIIYREKLFAVNLFVNTQRSLHGRMLKQSRHAKYENVITIDFPVSFTGSKEIGNFFLYGEKEYEALIEMMNKTK